MPEHYAAAVPGGSAHTPLVPPLPPSRPADEHADNTQEDSQRDSFVVPDPSTSQDQEDGSVGGSGDSSDAGSGQDSGQDSGGEPAPAPRPRAPAAAASAGASGIPGDHFGHIRNDDEANKKYTQLLNKLLRWVGALGRSGVAVWWHHRVRAPCHPDTLMPRAPCARRQLKARDAGAHAEAKRAWHVLRLADSFFDRWAGGACGDGMCLRAARSTPQAPAPVPTTPRRPTHSFPGRRRWINPPQWRPDQPECLDALLRLLEVGGWVGGRRLALPAAVRAQGCGVPRKSRQHAIHPAGPAALPHAPSCPPRPPPPLCCAGAGAARPALPLPAHACGHA